MKKYLHFLSLMMLLALASVNAMADSYSSVPAATKPQASMTSMQLKGNILTFSENLYATPWELPTSYQVRYTVYAVLNNKNVRLAQNNFGYYTYIVAKDREQNSTDELDYLRSAFIDKTVANKTDLNTSSDDCLKQIVSTWYDVTKSVVTRSLNIKTLLDNCKTLGVHDIKLCVYPEFRTGPAEEKTYSVYDKDKKGYDFDKWMVNSLDVSLPRVSYSTTLTHTDANGTQNKIDMAGVEYYTDVIASHTSKLSISLKGNVTTLTATWQGANVGSATKTVSYTKNTTINTTYESADISYQRKTGTENAYPYHCVINLTYKDLSDCLVSQSFKTEIYQVKYHPSWKIAKGTSYSTNGTTFVTATRDMELMADVNEKIYVNMRYAPNNAVTCSHSSYQPGISYRGDVATITNKGGEVSICGTRTVTVKVMCPRTNGSTPLATYNVLAGTEVVLPDVPATPTGCVFKGYFNASKRSDGKYVVSPTSDVTCSIEFQYIDLDSNDQGPMVNNIEGKIVVAPMTLVALTANKSLPETRGYGHVGETVSQSEDEEGYIRYVEGNRTAPLPEVDPTSHKGVMPEGFGAELVDGALAISATEECEVAIYDASGICIVAAQVRGNVSLPMSGKGVRIVVARSAGKVIWAQKYALK